MGVDLMDSIVDKENIIKINMEKNAVLILNNAIISLSDNDIDNSVVFPAMYLQIDLELFIKNYICKVYGFENILTSKYKKMRKNNTEQYLKELNIYSIKTLGFNDLKIFLEQENDYFGSVIKEGKSYLFNAEIQYDYLEGIFTKFQNIRNNFLHLGIDLKEEDKKWVRNEFYVVVIYFISTILNKQKKEEYGNVERDVNLCIDSIDNLLSKLSNKARLALKNDENFEGELASIAEDISEPMEPLTCTNCGKSTLALNIKDTDGISKCLYCGEQFIGDYCTCGICQDDTVAYDGLNIKENDNVILGYCYRCEDYVKVYKCQECGNAYAYNSQNPIHFKYKCCKRNFKDKFIMQVDN